MCICFYNNLKNIGETEKLSSSSVALLLLSSLPMCLKMRTASRSQFSVHHRLLLFSTLIKPSPSFLPPFEFSSPDCRTGRISSAWVSKFPLSIPFWTRPYFHSPFDPSFLEWALLLIPVNLCYSCSHRWRWYSSLTMERPPFTTTELSVLTKSRHEKSIGRKKEKRRKDRSRDVKTHLNFYPQRHQISISITHCIACIARSSQQNRENEKKNTWTDSLVVLHHPYCLTIHTIVSLFIALTKTKTKEEEEEEEDIKRQPLILLQWETMALVLWNEKSSFN